MERENESMRVAVIREDWELLAELAWLNTGMASLALRIMDGSASLAEQRLEEVREWVEQRKQVAKPHCT